MERWGALARPGMSDSDGFINTDGATCSDPPEESCSDVGCPLHGAENVWGGGHRMDEGHYPIWRTIGYQDDGDTEYEEIKVCATCVPKHTHFASRADVPEWPCQSG